MNVVLFSKFYEGPVIGLVILPRLTRGSELFFSDQVTQVFVDYVLIILREHLHRKRQRLSIFMHLKMMCHVKNSKLKTVYDRIIVRFADKYDVDGFHRLRNVFQRGRRPI